MKTDTQRTLAAGILIFFLSLSFLATPLFAMNKKVFIIASYEENHICGGPQEEGVVKGLNKEGLFEGENLDIKRFYMDTKRTNATLQAMQKVAGAIIEKIISEKPDVIVTLDDNAFREVGLRFAGKKNISVVFSGLNGLPEIYNEKKHFMNSLEKPGSNITGIYEKLYIVRSIKVMGSALKNLDGNKIIGITDYSPTGNALTKQFEIELKKKPENIEWELIRVKNWDEYKSAIFRINGESDVKAVYPVALSLKVSDTQTFTAPEIFKWTIENCKKPEMALNYFFSKIGLFGGAAVDFKQMGFATGKYAGKILNGESAGDLPIIDAPDYAIVFNLKRAKQLNIQIPAYLLTAADFVYK